MQSISRHQCLIHDGSPSQQLRAIAKVACKKLVENYRCIYFNSRPMIDLMRACLRAEGIGVESEIASGALVLTADLSHLVDGRFSVDTMIETIASALNQAIEDGYEGLWATGDMTWEFGPEHDFSKLVEYECRLEKLVQAHPRLCGICQYHVNSLSQDAIRQGILSHGRIFVNETLSLMNENFIPCASPSQQQSHFQALDRLVDRLLEAHSIS